MISFINRMVSLIACIVVASATVQCSQTRQKVVDQLSDQDYETFKSKRPDYWEAKGQTTTLRQVLLIHRHGDRTPINFVPGDKLANETFWTFHGLGQLTNRGKARLYMLGEIVRMRYNKFLGRSVNKNQIKSRASGSLRCIESSQVFLASFLSLQQFLSPDADRLRWDRTENRLAQQWQPASTTTLSASIDGMLNEGSSCQEVNREYKLIDQSEQFKQLTKDYSSEAKLIDEKLDFRMDSFYKWFWVSSFLEVELSYMAEKVDHQLKSAYERIEEAGNRAIVLYQSTTKAKRLRTGLLISDIIANMQELRRAFMQNTQQSSSTSYGPFTKKFVHYSAHDLNLVNLLGMLDNIDRFPSRPDYAANIIFELHQDQDGWFVKFFYMSHVPSECVELHFDECEKAADGSRCTLDRFDELMERYKIANWQQWMQECDNDLSTIDPYSQNS